MSLPQGREEDKHIDGSCDGECECKSGVAKAKRRDDKAESNKEQNHDASDDCRGFGVLRCVKAAGEDGLQRPGKGPDAVPAQRNSGIVDLDRSILFTKVERGNDGLCEDGHQDRAWDGEEQNPPYSSVELDDKAGHIALCQHRGQGWQQHDCGGLRKDSDGCLREVVGIFECGQVAGTGDKAAGDPEAKLAEGESEECREQECTDFSNAGVVELKFWDEGAAAAQNVHRREDKVPCDGPDKRAPGHRADAEVCSAKEPSRENLTEVIGHGSDGGDEEFLASVERAHHEAANKETPLCRE